MLKGRGRREDEVSTPKYMASILRMLPLRSRAPYFSLLSSSPIVLAFIMRTCTQVFRHSHRQHLCGPWAASLLVPSCALQSSSLVTLRLEVGEAPSAERLGV